MRDLTPTDVLQEPAAERMRSDTWSLRREGGERLLIRHHHLPRLGLFNPARSMHRPVNLDELSGKRTTETHFELLPDPQPAKKVKTPARRGEKRKADEIDKEKVETEEETTNEPGRASTDPQHGLQLPSQGLQAALQERGPDVVDDLPLRGESGANRCAVPGCDLPWRT